MLSNDKDDVASLGAFNRLDKLGNIERIDGLVVGFRGVVLESLVMEHQPKSSLLKPAFLG